MINGLPAPTQKEPREKDFNAPIWLKFKDEPLPVFKENKSDKITFYGDKNDFPEKLINLYNRSPKHNAIVTRKAKFINGKATLIEGDQTLVANWNRFDSLQEFKYKVILDKRIFGTRTIEVIYNMEKKPSYYHINAGKIRTLNHEHYEYWKDGAKTKKADRQYYDPYDPNNLILETEGPNKGKFRKQILYLRDYRADMGVYTLPDYIGGMQYIEIDTRISNFHLNNISNGFTGGTLVEFFKGQPEPEELRAIKRKFKAEYQGDDANETGGVVLSFNENNEQGAKVTPLTGNDLDKQFLMLNDHVTQEIFVCHGVTSPMLFGVRVEGQLGGRNELAEAYEVYYRDAIEKEQEEMDRLIEWLMKDMGNPGKCQTVKMEPIGQDWVTLYKEGLVSAEVAQENLGLPVIKAQVALEEHNPFGWSDADVSIFEQFGEEESNFEYMKFSFAELNEKEVKVMSAVNSNEKATVQEIADATKIAVPEVEKILTDLDKSSKIQWTNNVIKITEKGRGAINDVGGFDSIVIRWKYALDPASPPLRPGGESRPFCKKLIELGRVYSREDIDQMSSLLGYDVWKRRGGWYHNPETDVTVPHCRHEFKQVVLRRKNG